MTNLNDDVTATFYDVMSKIMIPDFFEVPVNVAFTIFVFV